MPGNIDGIRTVLLKKVTNERGHLLEIQRNDDPTYPGFGQAYVTCTQPGVVKAWYRHHRQFDQIALIKGELTLVSYDSREDSPTRDSVLELDLNDLTPKLVQIPPGIWHGFKALSKGPVYLVHLNSVPLDHLNADEDRLPWDSPAIPYTWS